MICGARTRVLLAVGVVATGSLALVAPVAAGPVPASAADSPKYVALGDSYSSLPAEATVGASAQERACGRSVQNYPKLVAASLHLAPGQLRDNTCGGAKTKDAFGVQRAGTEMTGLYDAAPQLSGIGQATELATISLGGNDDDLFGSIVAACPSKPVTHPRVCTFDERSRPAKLSNAAIRRTLDRVTAANERIVREVRGRAPRARIMLIGYPQVFLSDTTCAQISAYDKASLPWLRSVLTRDLNAALQRAATATGAEFIDMAPPSAGHELCSKDPWINGTHDVPQAQALHPFPAEGAAVARAIESALGGR